MSNPEPLVVAYAGFDYPLLITPTEFHYGNSDTEPLKTMTRHLRQNQTVTVIDTVRRPDDNYTYAYAVQAAMPDGPFPDAEVRQILESLDDLEDFDGE